MIGGSPEINRLGSFSLLQFPFSLFSTLHWVGFSLGRECILSWIVSIAISDMTIFLTHHMHQLGVTIRRNRPLELNSSKVRARLDGGFGDERFGLLFVISFRIQNKGHGGNKGKGRKSVILHFSKSHLK